MSNKNKIFVSCDEANHVCDKSQYKEASIREKIRLTIHLIFCRACRGYSSKNGKLTKLVNNPKVDCLKTKEKERIKNDFNKELTKH